MRETVDCPFCKKPLNTKLVTNFYFCKECEVAVRSESDMPCPGVNIYNRNWVQWHQGEKVNIRRAFYTQKQIAKLDGIRSVLDVGCGTGILVDILNRNGYIADGIDSSPDAIEFAKQHRKGNFYLAPIERYESKYKYDLIVASQLFGHLRNPEAFLLKAREFLKPSGYLYIEVANLYSLYSWKRGSIRRRRIGGVFYGRDHRIFYTGKSLSDLLQNNGFAIYKAFTKTYSPSILVGIGFTLYSFFGKNRRAGTREEIPAADLFANRTNKYLAEKIYRQTKDSLIVNVLLFIPNKVSEINGRGNQLIVIAKNTA